MTPQLSRLHPTDQLTDWVLERPVRQLAQDHRPERIPRSLPPLPGVLSEPPGADPHAGRCGRSQGEPGLPLPDSMRRRETTPDQSAQPRSPRHASRRPYKVAVGPTGRLRRVENLVDASLGRRRPGSGRRRLTRLTVPPRATLQVANGLSSHGPRRASRSRFRCRSEASLRTFSGGQSPANPDTSARTSS